MANHWLMKSEPGAYSWEQLLKDKKTYWDGVRNFQARNNLRAMHKKDLALFYHSVKEKSVVGVAQVVSEPYPDPTAKEGDWTVVDVAPHFGLSMPVHLSEIKQEPKLANMALIKQSRLSVSPLTKAEFDQIVKMGKRIPLSKA